LPLASHATVTRVANLLRCKDPLNEESSTGVALFAAKPNTPERRIAILSASIGHVEVAQRNGIVFLRNSNRPRGNGLQYTAEEWQSFILSIKAGELNDFIGVQERKKKDVQIDANEFAGSERAKRAPQNWLDLIDRIHRRATSSWGQFLMHLILLILLVMLLAAFFGGLGWAFRGATGVPPWITATGSLGCGATVGGAVYVRRRRNAPVKSDETGPGLLLLTYGTLLGR